MGGKNDCAMFDCLCKVRNRLISHHHSNFLYELQLGHRRGIINFQYMYRKNGSHDLSKAQTDL